MLQRQDGCQGGEEAASVTPPPNDVTALPAQNQQSSVTIACRNCATTITPLWRRDGNDHVICNACGLYYRLHRLHRPITMKKATIKRRKRVISANQEEEAEDGDVEMESRSNETIPERDSASAVGTEGGYGNAKQTTDQNTQFHLGDLWLNNTHEKDKEAERTQVLEREAERIREMLAAKERELYKLRTG
ncbi:hypothetical protein LMH87_001401 [Akanthomyces muscarius]|uniref:GATA-type domain-containing protein n=1 Tax=Akanthomyces muscarius TaxID=2231603 RepID=A0A9W8UI56_AKAMU|nr:hypothetical protein LMH87_001401 [Akanthomyces muscarius]KAJ4146842.1 hypothetical protein LMH87_001401 [Akanthomyces muscarius]